MSKFFPNPKVTQLNSDVELIAFDCQDTLVQLVYLAPKATFALHQHLDSQMGMIISGRLQMNVNGIKKIIEPLQQAYIANAYVPHGSVNIFPEPALVFDVKRIINFSETTDEAFLKVSPTQDEITGLSCQSVVASWFEIVIIKIPTGGNIPRHQSTSEQMGIILSGQLMMTVGEEQQQLQYGRIYYAPANVFCGGYNSSDEEVTLIEILIPPRSGLSYKRREQGTGNREQGIINTNFSCGFKAHLKKKGIGNGEQRTECVLFPVPCSLFPFPGGFPLLPVPRSPFPLNKKLF